MNRQAEFEFIKIIIMKSSGETETELEQLRALWTAYCLHQDLNADTYEYDKDIGLLWTSFTYRGQIPARFKNIKEFDLYMSKYLV